MTGSPLDPVYRKQVAKLADALQLLEGGDRPRAAERALNSARVCADTAKKHDDERGGMTGASARALAASARDTARCFRDAATFLRGDLPVQCLACRDTGMLANDAPCGAAIHAPLVPA